MKAVVARCTGVDVEHVERLVVLHLQDVGMSADEELWRTHHQASHYRGVVLSRITAYVLHHHLGLLHGEAQRLGIEASDVLSVDVSIHCTQGAEGCQALGHLQRADVARVPYFVATFEVFQVLFVPKCVCIR